MIKSKYSAAITDKPWWLAGGIPRDACVAAYQAVGVDSQVGSYTNLSNPGIYNLSVVGSPVTWSSINGWGNDFTIANHLDTGIMAGKYWSMIARYSELSSSTTYQFICGTDNAQNRRFYLFPKLGVSYAYGAGGYNLVANQAKLSGVAAIVGRYSYYNGVNIGPITNADYSDVPQYSLTIGIANNATKQYPCIGYIQAVAIYNTTLCASQVVSLTNAMNTL